MIYYSADNYLSDFKQAFMYFWIKICFMGLIKLENIEIYAYHGCFEEEQIVGNWFQVNLTLETPMELAAKTDNIKDALNYQSVVEIVRKEMAIKSHLLENVAQRILIVLFTTFNTLLFAEVSVSKMNPPVGGKMKCVTVVMSQKK